MLSETDNFGHNTEVSMEMKVKLAKDHLKQMGMLKEIKPLRKIIPFGKRVKSESALEVIEMKS